MPFNHYGAHKRRKNHVDRVDEELDYAAAVWRPHYARRHGSCAIPQSVGVGSFIRIRRVNP